MITLKEAQMKAALANVVRYTYIGRVVKVIGLTIEAVLPKAAVGAMCEIQADEGQRKILCEVIGLKHNHAVLMPIGQTSGIKVDDAVLPVRSQATVKVSPMMIGRILNGLGEAMDDLGPIGLSKEYPLYHDPMNAINRKMISEPLPLGIRAIDGFMTCGVGQRMSIMAGSGVGKSTTMAMIARNAKADVNVIGLIGERGREVREFIEHDLGKEGLARSVIIIATSDQPALVRMRAAFVATTVAEYFRDQGKKVLLMVDSLTRFAMASREVGLSLGEPPTMRGYTPSIFALLPKLLERAGTTDHSGSITGLYTILTEGDDIQDPIADTVRSIVDGHIVLSRKLANNGHYPAIDVLGSLSRVMNRVVNDNQLQSMMKVRRMIALYEDMEDFIKMGAYTSGKNPELDLAIKKISEIKKFLLQNIEEKCPFEEVSARLQTLAS